MGFGSIACIIEYAGKGRQTNVFKWRRNRVRRCSARSCRAFRSGSRDVSPPRWMNQTRVRSCRRLAPQSGRTSPRCAPTNRLRGRRGRQSRVLSVQVGRPRLASRKRHLARCSECVDPSADELGSDRTPRSQGSRRMSSADGRLRWRGAPLRSIGGRGADRCNGFGYPLPNPKRGK